MTARELIESLGVIAEAPDGVKRLRELVLGLAVRGKLVGQDAGDESASTLLGARATRPMPGSTPFELPHGWSWSSLNRLGEVVGGGTPSKSNSSFWDGPIPWVSPKDMKIDRITDAEDHVSEAAVRGSAAKLLPAGALLMVVRGMILAHSFPTALTEVAVTVNQDMKALLPFDVRVAAWLLLMSKGMKRNVLDLVERSTHGTCKLKTDDLLSMSVPVPPLAEQHRIVAKVDELMAFLDKLEAAKAARDATRTALRNAALAQLRDADGPDEVGGAWGRIAGQMQELFSQPEDVGPLRQAVLQLAVRGRLVRQDPDDEPAGKLLERISKLKTRLTKSGKVPKGDLLPAVSEGEAPFALPDGWAWQRIGTVAELINGDRSKNYPNKEEYVGPEGVAFINTGHILPDGSLSLDSMHYISRTKFNSLRSGKIVQGDLVYCLRGTIGKTAFVEPFDEGAIASSLVIVRPYLRELSPYLYRLLTSPHGMREVRKYDNGSAQPNLSAGNTASFLLPLPPLAEQDRITAKVDELFAFLDNLETRLKSARELQASFAAAAVHHLELEVAA